MYMHRDAIINRFYVFWQNRNSEVIFFVININFIEPSEMDMNAWSIKID